jgi:hypothetical protein
MLTLVGHLPTHTYKIHKIRRDSGIDLLQSTSVTGIAVRCRVPRSRNFRSGTRNGNDAVQSQERAWVVNGDGVPK